MRKFFNFAVMSIIAMVSLFAPTTVDAQESYYSQRADDSYSTSFRTSSDVMSYLSSRTFYDGKVNLRIAYDAVYANGNAITAAPIVSDITSTSAFIRATSAYIGGREFTFFLNASKGTISCLESGEKFYLK